MLVCLSIDTKLMDLLQLQAVKMMSMTYPLAVPKALQQDTVHHVHLFLQALLNKDQVLRVEEVLTL